ncbi:MAG: helix-turn-helix transcriptional regulator [Kibdelosporangium sp.]
MTEPTRSTFLRRKLGAKLRRMREKAEFTLDKAAAQLDKTRTALHRIEKGETKPDVHLVRSMMDLYDSYDEDLIEEVREARKPPWYRAFGTKNMGYVDVETEAARVQQLLLVDMPGLLQTESYMRALFTTDPSRSQRALNNDIAVRLIRQRRLSDEHRPLELVAVVYEPALRRKIGDPQVMHEQLRNLIDMSGLPTVTLQVVPLEGGSYRVPNGPFTLLTFPDPEDLQLLYIEYPTGSLHIEDAKEVQEATLVFDRLQNNALSPADSVALIKRLIISEYGH